MSRSFPVTRISNRQWFMMAIATTVSYGHFVWTHLAILYAGRETWLALLLGGVLGIAVVFGQLKLCVSRKQSLDQLILQAFGPPIGRIVLILCFGFLLLAVTFTLKEVVVFLGMVYPSTPFQVFLLGEALLISWSVKMGIEVIGRCTEFLVPILIVIGIMAALMTWHEKDPAKLLPLIEKPFSAIWRASVVFLSMVCEWMAFLFLALDAATPDQLPRQSLLTGGIVMVMFLGPVTGPVMMFGEKLAQQLAYPTYTEIQSITISDIVERLDTLGVLLWLLGSFLRLSIFSYVMAKLATVVFNGRTTGDFVLPMVLLSCACTIALREVSREEVHRFLMHDYPVLALGFGILLPTIVWIALRLRGP